jgi:hypothetical protein
MRKLVIQSNPVFWKTLPNPWVEDAAFGISYQLPQGI